MDEPDQNSPSSLSSQQLLEDLENFIILESKRNGNPWIRVDRFTDYFYEKYGVSPEEVAAQQGCSNDLRSFIRKSRRFSIYSTQVPHQFFVALLETIVSGSQASQTSLISYRIKRPWKIDERLLNLIKTEGGEEIPPYQPDLSKYQPILVPEIESIEDLGIALSEMVKSLTGNNPKEFVSIGTLSKEFSSYYQQPIRAVIRSVNPDLKLIDLLQSITILNVQKMDDGWQVSVEADSID